MPHLSLVIKTFLVFLILTALTLAAVIFIPNLANSQNLTLIVAVISLLATLLASFLAFKARLKLLNIAKTIKNLPETNFEEEIETEKGDEFGKVSDELESLRRDLKKKIISLEESRDRAEALLTNVGEGVFAVDLRGEVIIFNQVAEKLFEYEREKMLNKNYSQALRFYNTKTKETYSSFIDKVLLEGKTITLPAETVLNSATNNQIPVAVSASPIKNHKGIIIGAIVVFRDITKEMELEEMRTDLISIASHQLRTPISEIKGLTELLADNVAGPLNSKQHEYLQMLEVANERMISLINDMLNVSRLEQGRLQFQFNVYDLGTITSEIFNFLKVQADKKSQHFFLNIDSESHLVWVDSAKTKEIVSNLMENALKYTYPGGTIQVRVTKSEEGVWFLVKDNGVGIPREKQKDLFKKFSRIENPLSKNTTGTGLGLYTVKQMVERQRGKIFVKSEEGKGTTFAVLFPSAKLSQ